MSTEHKRPLYAFAILALACALFVGNGLRSDAIGGALRADDGQTTILSVPPPAEQKVASVTPPRSAAPSSLRMVSVKSASAPGPTVGSSSQAIAAAKVVRTKTTKSNKAPRATVTKPRPGSNGSAKHAVSTRTTHGPARHQGHRVARGHQGPRGHTRGQSGAHPKNSRNAHRAPGHGHRGDRGQQHRPRETGQGRGAEQRHQRGQSGKGHDARQHRGNHQGNHRPGGHGQGNKQTGNKQSGKPRTSQRGGRGGSSSHSRRV